MYTACDCLVHPYRGEGFALPVAEAMACGLPVVVTGRGAALDYCNGERAYLVPAGVGYFPEQRVGELETVARPWLAEPDPAALADILHHIFAHPREAQARGRVAGAFVRRCLTWEHAADAVERRLAALQRRPVRRLEHRSRAMLAPSPPRPPSPTQGRGGSGGLPSPLGGRGVGGEGASSPLAPVWQRGWG